MHTERNLYLVAFFLTHVLISLRFSLARWRLGRSWLTDVQLIAIGILSFWFNLSIR